MSAPLPIVSVDRVERVFPGGRRALAGVSLQLARGELVGLVGPSGCGKSTLLRLIAGLDVPDAGKVDSPATRSGGRAPVAFVFQDSTLMPWASVFDNVWLPLRLAGLSRDAASHSVTGILARVGLADVIDAYPAELSGGMRMRVSIARALVTQPQLLLMDEPFAALDQLTRQRLNQDLLSWCAERDLGALFVTHSVAEAVFLCSRVLVMSAHPGRLLDEVSVDMSGPRDARFRASPQFAALCGRISETLEAA
ncbi:MAG: ABC transporter ATP-binding protein [Steroidobacteraceae bacterium]